MLVRLHPAYHTLDIKLLFQCWPGMYEYKGRKPARLYPACPILDMQAFVSMLAK